MGGLYNTLHGPANAVILPRVIQNYGKKVHKKLAQLTEIAGIVPAGTSKKTDAEKADIFIDSIFVMNRRIGIADCFGFIKHEDIPLMTEWAFKEANPVYPVPVIVH